MKTIDSVNHKYLGEVRLGFYRNIYTDKIVLNLKPIPANQDDAEAMTIMALYAAAIKQSVEVIGKVVSESQLLKGIANAVEKENKSQGQPGS